LQKLYDIIVVGAGIAGCAVANRAKSMGKSVLLLDRSKAVATGGSGAAGAFISPKLGKKTPLLELTNQAYRYATYFYTENYPKYFYKTAMVRLPKDEADAKEFANYQKYIGGKLISKDEQQKLGVECKYDALYFSDGGFCDAVALCNALIEGVEFVQEELKEFASNKEQVVVNGKYRAKNLLLATGYEGSELCEYMGISGIWGSRGDFVSTNNIAVSMHKSVSVSANIGGIIRVGATHVRAKSALQACTICDGNPLEEIIKSAYEIAKLDNLELKQIFCGMRSGSRDYFPLVGKVIDARYMLEHYPQIKKGYNKVEFKYIDRLYILNGVGGRGFVFAPLLAKWACELIFEDKSVDSRVDPNRLFFKWARRLK
jgi:tRNA 5-methylaminomethyl-2-thiouridine biosynthesis bifunctional protein